MILRSISQHRPGGLSTPPRRCLDRGRPRARGSGHWPGRVVTPYAEGYPVKDGLRFVDCDMHIMEPPDLFDRYLDPKFKHRVSVPGGRRRPAAPRAAGDASSSTGCPPRDMRAPAVPEARAGRGSTQSTQPLSGSRLVDTGRLDFADRARLRRRGAGDGHGDGGRRHRGALPDQRASPSSPATTWIRSCPWPSARPTTTGSTSSASTAPTS